MIFIIMHVILCEWNWKNAANQQKCACLTPRSGCNNNRFRFAYDVSISYPLRTDSIADVIGPSLPTDSRGRRVRLLTVISLFTYLASRCVTQTAAHTFYTHTGHTHTHKLRRQRVFVHFTINKYYNIQVTKWRLSLIYSIWFDGIMYLLESPTHLFVKRTSRKRFLTFRKSRWHV